MQLLSNFMANWVAEKKKKDKNYGEQNYHPNSPPHSCSPRHPQPSLPAGGVPCTPLYPPCKGISGFLALSGALQSFSPPPHPKTNTNPCNNPIPGQSRSQEPRGRYSLTTGASSPSLPVPRPPPAPAAGMAYAATDPASHGASSPAARGLANSSHVSAGWGLTPTVEAELPSRGAGQPPLQRSFLCPYFRSPIKVFP